MLSLKAGSRYWHNREYRKADIVFTLESSPLFFLSWWSVKKGLQIVCQLIRAFRGFLQGFSQLVNHGAFGNSISVDDSFEISLNVIIERMKSFDRK